MAAERGAFIDQSQSLNLFMETPTIGKLSSMYLHAWKAGLKTTYYLRSRPATRINQSTTTGAAKSSTATVPPTSPTGGGQSTPADVAIAPLVDEPAKKTFTDEDAVACSLENPETCEACD
jgi:ribonucleoside-diphosphate reductase alpha chain